MFFAVFRVKDFGFRSTDRWFDWFVLEIKSIRHESFKVRALRHQMVKTFLSECCFDGDEP